MKLNPSKSNVAVKEYTLWIVKGGWHESHSMDESEAIPYLRSYINALCEEDINKIHERSYSGKRMMKILQSLAKNIASELTNINILADVSEVVTSQTSLIKYLDVLRRLYITEDLDSWNLIFVQEAF